MAKRKQTAAAIATWALCAWLAAVVPSSAAQTRRLMPGGVSNQVEAQGAVSPETGTPHSFVIVTGAGIGSADGIRVVWYPGDDAGQPASGAVTATLRRRIPPDQVEIEIPAGAGGPQGGVVRILARMPGQRTPVFVARFTVGAAEPPIETGRLMVNGLRPRAIAVAPLQVSGSRPRTILAKPIRVSGTRPRDIATRPLVVSGKH